MDQPGGHQLPHRAGRLAIVGGGWVGVEMASAWAGLGAAVILLAQADGLLPRMEPFAGEIIARAFADAGIDVRIGVTVAGARRPGGTGPVTLTLEDGREVEADEVLFATGRQPATDDIGLDTVGLEPGSWLEVDDTCMVRALTDGWLYALGDVNHHALLTHQGKYQARIAGRGDRRPRRRAAHRPSPVGPACRHRRLSRGASGVLLRSLGRSGRAYRRPGGARRAPHPRRRRRPRPSGSRRGLFADGYTGRARMVVDEDHDCLLGVTFVGPGMEELIHSATIAVAGQVPLACSGTPSPASLPSAKSGCACWRPTAADPQTVFPASRN